MIRSTLLALALLVVGSVPTLEAACQKTTGASLVLSKIRIGDSPLVWPQCVNDSFDLLASSGVSLSSMTALFDAVAVDTTTLGIRLDQVAIDTTTLFTNKLARDGSQNMTGQLTVNSTFTVTGDATVGGNLGVRTASPAHDLSIGNGTGSNVINLDHVSGGTSQIDFDRAGSRVGGITWDDAGSTSMTLEVVSGGKFVFTGGNVGIGSTDVETQLYVLKTDNGSDDIFRIEANNETAGIGMGFQRISALGTNQNLTLLSNGTGDILLNTTQGNNVGVGTVSPDAGLHVESVVRSTGVHITGWSPIRGTASALDGSLQIGGPTNGTDGFLLHYNSQGQTTSSLDSSFDSATSVMRFMMRTNGTPVEAMTILGSGRLGVNQASPTARFDVVALGDIAAKFTGVNGSDTVFVKGGSGSSASFGLLIDAGTTSSDYAMLVRDQTATSTYFKIRGDGNVGIGQATPTSILHFKSETPTLTCEDTTDGVICLIGNANNLFVSPFNTAADLGIRAKSGSGIVFGDGTTGNMRIDPSGNVGIANAAPVGLLHVGAGADAPQVPSPTIHASVAGTAIISARDSTNDVEVGMRAIAAGGLIGTHTNHPLDIRTNDTNRIRIEAGGNVGIGTTSPTKTLELDNSGVASVNLQISQHNAVATGSKVTIRQSAGTGAAPLITASNATLGNLEFLGHDGASFISNGGALIQANIDGTVAATRVPAKLDFYTATNAAPSVVTLRMTITSAGNVGIGAAIPTEKLHVVGDSRITGLVSCDTIDTDANGVLSCGTDETVTGTTGHRISSDTVSGDGDFVQRSTLTFIGPEFLVKDGPGDQTTVESAIKMKWVTFTGTGTVTIQDSFGISSVTDNGLGDYTINFTTPFSNGDYSKSCTLDPDPADPPLACHPVDAIAGSARIDTVATTTGNPIDPDRVYMQFMGN